jgi:hypothetical protein
MNEHLRRQMLLYALSSDQAGECFNALQKWKQAMCDNGHGDIHVLVDHIEKIGKDIVPAGYCSPEELQKQLEAAAHEAMQKGREIERLSRGQSATNWHDVFVHCRDHRPLHAGNETQMIHDWCFRTEHTNLEPPPKVEAWVKKILMRPRI